jgi:exopolyphosphatase / guanosine-5'-triphosphate,3'-diphosphate pyrophosphatase
LNHIVPRWEWRTFGQDFGAADQRFTALTVEKVQNSDEIYLLAVATDANVKIRDELMDIKLLERLDANGLEQWRPVLKEPFPLDPGAVAQVRAALGLPPARAVPESLPLDRLLAELAPPNGPVRIVSVKKTRMRYHVEGCVAERTDVIADGKKVRTVAIEDQDPARVIAAMAAMALEGYPNISYPRGLKQLLGIST